MVYLVYNRLQGPYKWLHARMGSIGDDVCRRVEEGLYVPLLRHGLEAL